MSETENNQRFFNFFRRVPLEDTVEALRLARLHNLFHEWNEKPSFLLFDGIYRLGILKDNDSFLMGIAKAHSLAIFYKENSYNCDDIIVKWDEGEKNNGKN